MPVSFFLDLVPISRILLRLPRCLSHQTSAIMAERINLSVEIILSIRCFLLPINNTLIEGTNADSHLLHHRFSLALEYCPFNGLRLLERGHNSRFLWRISPEWNVEFSETDFLILCNYCHIFLTPNWRCENEVRRTLINLNHHIIGLYLHSKHTLLVINVTSNI